MVEFDAVEIVRGVGELYEPLADDKGLTLIVDARGPATIRGNRELLSQALANLVDNAIKYAQPAAQSCAGEKLPAEIVVGAQREGDRVLLTVADRGPGIAEGDRVKAVERFVRLSHKSGEPGSGLGLSLAAAVARLHGGRLTLEDNAPGLKVVISLPSI